MPRPLLALIAVGILCSCGRDSHIQQALPPNVRVDTYTQVAASKIDVLWVVDNSGSMAPRQENVARNFQNFIDVFVQSSVDYRLAVTTTDIFNQPGELFGNPKIISPSTPNPTQAFAQNVRVGTAGSAYEAGLSAADIALQKIHTANEQAVVQLTACEKTCTALANSASCLGKCVTDNPVNFLRPDAFLYLVFVSDEDDKSEGDIRYFWRSFETTQGIGNDGTVSTAAIVGDAPTNSCGATPGSRYLSLSQLTGGQVGSICDQEFSSTLHKLATNAVGLKRTFALGMPPNVDTLEVRILYPCSDSDAQLSACETIDRKDCQGAGTDDFLLKCTPAHGAANGWSYVPEKNAVFFAGDSVPLKDAHLEIQYYQEGAQP